MQRLYTPYPLYLLIVDGSQLQFSGKTLSVGVNVGDTLLPVFVSPVTGVVVAVNVGFVPTVVAPGVTGTLNVLLPLDAIGPGLVQVTEGADVEHVQPLLVKVAGAVTPAGNVIVVVIIPGAEPVPTFATVIGKSLGCPTVNGVNGCPTVVVISGTPNTIGVVVLGGLLFVVFVSPVTGDVVPVKTNGEPTAAGVGVTGTRIKILLPAAIGPGFVHVTN
jgi:hypothetical protein